MQETERRRAAGADGAPRWDVSAMGSAYCNIATAAATRDAVVINLGLSQRADERASAQWRSQLLHRVLLSPRTAKQLHAILGTLLGEHDAQRGGPR